MILIVVICWVIRSLGLKLRGEAMGDPKIWAVVARFDNHPLFIILQSLWLLRKWMRNEDIEHSLTIIYLMGHVSVL